MHFPPPAYPISNLILRCSVIRTEVVNYSRSQRMYISPMLAWGRWHPNGTLTLLSRKLGKPCRGRAFLRTSYNSTNVNSTDPGTLGLTSPPPVTGPWFFFVFQRVISDEGNTGVVGFLQSSLSGSRRLPNSSRGEKSSFLTPGLSASVNRS